MSCPPAQRQTEPIKARPKRKDDPLGPSEERLPWPCGLGNDISRRFGRADRIGKAPESAT